MLEKPRSLQSWIDTFYKVKGRKHGSSTEFAQKQGVTKQTSSLWKRQEYIVYKGVMYSPMRQLFKRNGK
jgi:hypothetical protein